MKDQESKRDQQDRKDPISFKVSFSRTHSEKPIRLSSCYGVRGGVSLLDASNVFSEVANDCRTFIILEI